MSKPNTTPATNNTKTPVGAKPTPAPVATKAPEVKKPAQKK
jgi:hypothetical protein